MDELMNHILMLFPALESISRDTLQQVIEEIYQEGYGDGEAEGYSEGYGDCLYDNSIDEED